jgi:hypothetical protein
VTGRRVLFLDIDGVLNGHEYDPLAASCGLRPDCVARLNRVLDETGCEVVLSSAWRYMVLMGALTLSGFGYLLRTHGVRNLGTRLVGTTGLDTQTEDPTERGRLIVAWLMEQVGVAQAVVVDDMPILGPETAHLDFVQTDGKTGLTDADADRLILLLRGRPSFAAAPGGEG